MATKKMTFHESYGEVTTSLLKAIKKHNVSPADFMMLEMTHGEGNFDAIEADIKANVEDCMYRMYRPKFG